MSNEHVNTYQFLFFREIGNTAAHRYRKHELRYAEYFPGPYQDRFDKRSLSEKEWKNELENHNFYDDLSEFAKEFYIAIAQGTNSANLNSIIDNMHEQNPTLDIFSEINNLPFLRKINPLSFLRSSYSADIRDFFWGLITTNLAKLTPEEIPEHDNSSDEDEHTNEMQPRLQKLFWLALCTHQPAERMQSLITIGAQAQPSEEGTEIEDEDEIFPLPLHFACWSGNIDNAQCLLNNGADASKYNEADITPLHLACQHGTAEMVQLLFEYTRYENNENSNGHNPFYYSCLGGNTETAKYLIEFNHVTPEDLNFAIGDASESGNVEFVEFLHRKGAPLNNNLHCPLTFACTAGHTSLVKFLVDRGATTPPTRDNPLKIACKNGKTQTAAFLLDRIKPITEMLDTLLTLTAYPIFSELIKLLSLENTYLLIEESIKRMPEKNDGVWDNYWTGLAEIYTDIIEPICIRHKNPDLLLLCAIRTEQPQDEIEHIIINLGANVDRAGGKYEHIPIHISTRFNSAATCVLLQYGSSHAYEFALPFDAERSSKRLKH